MHLSYRWWTWKITLYRRNLYNAILGFSLFFFKWKSNPWKLHSWRGCAYSFPFIFVKNNRFWKDDFQEYNIKYNIISTDRCFLDLSVKLSAQLIQIKLLIQAQKHFFFFFKLTILYLSVIQYGAEVYSDNFRHSHGLASDYRHYFDRLYCAGCELCLWSILPRKAPGMRKSIWFLISSSQFSCVFTTNYF